MNPDSLVQTLLVDNQTVREMKLSHQKIATPLIVITSVAKNITNEFEFSYFSTRYKVKKTQWVGRQESPFADQGSANFDLKVTNLDTGQGLAFSAMLGPLIYSE